MLRSWCAVVALMMGFFSIVTTEILPIGLLTSIGSDFAVSDGTAGLMMTMPGLLAAVAAPAVTVATARLDRRTMLCAFMALLTLANVLVVVAPAFWVVLLSRVLVGVTIGGFWSIGAGLGGRLVANGPRATSIVFSAVPLGSVLGVPAGTLIGGLAGWRAAFAVMAALSAAVLVALAVLLPPLPPQRVTRPHVLAGLLRLRGVRAGLLVTFLIVLAHFGTYTYVTPFLQDVTHASPTTITALLLVYGAAGILGNFAAAPHAARHPRATFATAAGLLAVATLLLPVLGRWPSGAFALLLLWGIAYGAVPVCSQTWFTKAAPHTPEAASVIFTASFQATLSFGALTGGATLDHTSPSILMLLGATTATLTIAAISTRSPAHPRPPLPTEPRPHNHVV